MGVGVKGRIGVRVRVKIGVWVRVRIGVWVRVTTVKVRVRARGSSAP